MAQIQTVDYEAMPGQAEQMRGYGRQLNNEMTTAYTSIANMHDNWYGKRYNELVKAFNEMIPQLNEMLTLVVTDIPYALDTVANNYAQADTGANVTTANNEATNPITEIATSSDVGMKFITSEVSSVQSSVSTNFSNATDYMNNIESAYNTITWQSEASEAFKAKFTKLKSDIVTSFENIRTSFSELMTQAQNDVQSAEDANTVS